MDSLAIGRKTGFTYDPRCEQHFCAWDTLATEGPHRTRAIMKRLQNNKDGLIEECQLLKARYATLSEVLSVHSEELTETVNRICSEPADTTWQALKKFSELYHVTYVSPASEKCALLAAGQSVTLATEVWKGTIKNGLAVVRPPGHHASANESNGFCIYNNVAIAARQLIEHQGAQRVLIVDWDVHHGQGTQRTFYNDKRVLYFSLHRYEHGNFWPNLRESNFDYIGEGHGIGYNINVPLNKTGLGDAEYLAILYQILLPVAYEFNPEIVIVSAGYDAAMGCPEGRMNVTPALYGHFTHALGSLAGGKVAVILEGGYCDESLSEGVACTLEALLGRPLIPLAPIQLSDPSVGESIRNVSSVLRDHWKCLNFQGNPPASGAGDFQKGVGNRIPEMVFLGPDQAGPNEAYSGTLRYPPSVVVDIRHEIAALVRGYDLFRADRPSQRTCLLIDEDGQTGQPRAGICNHLKRCGLLEKCTLVKDRASTTTSSLCGTGSLQCVADEILSGRSLNGFVVCSRPDHQSPAQCRTGLCSRSNVGTVAKHLVEWQGLKRVLIVDWDGRKECESSHDDPRILQLSINRTGPSNDKPNKGSCSSDAGNEDKSRKNNINLTWSESSKSDGDYCVALLQLVMPIAYEFAPEIILMDWSLSAGTEGHQRQDLDAGTLSPRALYLMTYLLRALAGGRLIISLNSSCEKDRLEVISEFAVRALLDLPLARQSDDNLIPSSGYST